MLLCLLFKLVGEAAIPGQSKKWHGLASRVRRTLYGLLAATMTTLSFLYCYGLAGFHGQSAFRRFLGLPSKVWRIGGTVSPGWESVRAAFENNYRLGLERSSQYVVYHKGVKVVDLYGSIASEKYNANSCQLVYSCTKVLTSIALSIAVDRGLLLFDERISSYWPEFSASHPPDSQKHLVTVGDLMRHQAGMAFLDEPITENDVRHQESGDLGRKIERSNVNFHPTSRRAYHSMTRG